MVRSEAGGTVSRRYHVCAQGCPFRFLEDSLCKAIIRAQAVANCEHVDGRAFILTRGRLLRHRLIYCTGRDGLGLRQCEASTSLLCCVTFDPRSAELAGQSRHVEDSTARMGEDG